MSKFDGCSGCLRLCRAIARNHGSSMRKALFRNGSRQTAARRSAGHAADSTTDRGRFSFGFLSLVIVGAMRPPALRLAQQDLIETADDRDCRKPGTADKGSTTQQISISDAG